MGRKQSNYGYVVTTIQSIAGETHKAAYGAVGAVTAVTVIVPAIGVVIAIILFSFGFGI